jgi:hypothetical protein
MRAKVEGTGAVFHSAVDCEPELFLGRGTDFISMVMNLAKEFEDQGIATTSVARLWQLRLVMIELQLPGLLRLLRKLDADALVFCPLSCPEADIASRILDVPSVALNTFSGPGGLADAVTWCFQDEKVDYQEFNRMLRQWPPNVDACDRMLEKYGVPIDTGLPNVSGHLHTIAHSNVTLSTTADGLQIPMSPELQHAYAENRCVFEYVGPLIDRAGTWRSHLPSDSHHVSDVISRIRAARALGRRVVFASMGTVITGNMPYWGWEGRPVGEDGLPYGLSGSELCRAAWAGVFDAFGCSSSTNNTPALIVLALGPQPEALGGLEAPANAICAPAFPQVDILAEGIDVFLTHGGQNSFMEAVSSGTPVVVCPGFSDQVTNSQKAVALGIGLKVDRPVPAAGNEAAAVQQYRESVCQALLQVVSKPNFAACASGWADSVKTAGGVPRAADILLRTVATGSGASATHPVASVAGA